MSLSEVLCTCLREVGVVNIKDREEDLGESHGDLSGRTG